MTQLRIFFTLSCLVLCNPLLASEPQVVRFVQNESRHRYEIELLGRALELTQDEYGKARALHVTSGSRNIHYEQGLARNQFDVAFMPSSPRKESILKAIKVPLLQGMLGYRLLLIRPETVEKLQQVTGVEDFQKRLIGTAGLRWEDFQIYRRNQLLVKAAANHIECYQRLHDGDVDYFARGVNQVFRESTRLPVQFKQIEISRDLSLFYPLPFYFYVGRENLKLAERLSKGLRLATADGSFKSIFIKHFHTDIEALKKLDVKRVIYLKNTAVKLEQPMKLDWWLDKPLRAH